MVISVISGRAPAGKTTIAKVLTDKAKNSTKINYNLNPSTSSEFKYGKNNDFSNKNVNFKLISHLNKNGRIIGEDEEIIFLDSPAVTKCNIVSTIAISDAALIVVEPKEFDVVDLVKIISLCKYFGILVMICINKCNVNIDVDKKIERYINDNKLILVGRIPYYSDLINKNKIEEDYNKEHFTREPFNELFDNIKKCILGGINNENCSCK